MVAQMVAQMASVMVELMADLTVRDWENPMGND